MKEYYKKVSVKDELPEEVGDYFVIKNQNGQKINHQAWFNGEKFDSAMIEFWLKPIPAPQDTMSENKGEWQLCPKCNGTGRMIPQYETSASFVQCDVCNGAQIMSTPTSQDTIADMIEQLPIGEWTPHQLNNGSWIIFTNNDDYFGKTLPEALTKYINYLNKTK